MKVLYVIKNLEVGGAERFVADIVPKLVRDGVDVRVVLVTEGEALAGPLREAGIDIVRLGHPDSGMFSPMNVRSSAGRLREVIREYGPDIVHPHLYLAELVSFLAADARTRLIATLHNKTPWWDWRSAAGKRFRYWAMVSLESALFRMRNARFVAVSNSTRDDAIKHLGLRPERVRTIYNGIDPDRFVPKESYGADAGPVIIQVGNLNPVKGHVTSLRAFRLVLDRHPGARLLMAGEGGERPRLEKMIRELGLGGAAELLGRRMDIAELLQSSDIFWMPSVSEGFGIASIEAMASGLPAVVSDTTGLNETVEDGVTGYLVGVGDFEALAKRTLDIAGDAGLAERLGRSGRTRVEKMFSADVTAAGYAAAYEDFLDGAW